MDEFGSQETQFPATYDLLELAQEAGQVGIFEWSVPDGRVRLSPKFLSLYGLVDFDGRYESWVARIFREDRPRILHQIEATFAEQAREMHAEFRITFAGGGPPRWIEGRYLIFYGRDGSPARVVGVNVDITDRKQALVRLRSFTESLEDAVKERLRIEEQLREESSTLEILNRTGEAIAAELDLERVVQTVTDAGVELTGAKFGAFFYNVLDAAGDKYMLYTLSGAARSDFEKFGMPRATGIFHPTFVGEGTVRSDDITTDHRYGKNDPHKGMPEGHLPVRSYLAVSVTSRSGEVIGGLFFGHPQPGRFTARHERVMTGIAAQAAVSLDNARLYQAAQKELAERLRAQVALRELNDTLEQRVADEIERRGAAEEALRQSQKMETVGQLTGGIAHDFNNLLQVVTGNLEILLRNIPEDSPRLRRSAANAMTGAQRAAILTQRLLAFSRRQPLQPKAIDINRLVAAMHDLLHRTLGETIEVEAVLAPRLWCVEADPH
jgi:GAF domain-containing protein